MIPLTPLVLLLAGCGDDPAPDAGSLPVDHPPVGTIGTGSDAPITDPTVSAGRPWRRMNLDQVAASLERVSGGIVWEEDGEPVLDDLAATLGKPDFSQSTREDLTPNLLFQKFLDDAATYTCTALIDREAAGAADPVFLVHANLRDTLQSNPDAVNANLAYLVLRYHGRAVAADADELEPWRFLFESVLLVTDDDTAAAWRAVCVGLITHPDFYTY
ncbi:MAG: hypothetical protein ABMB14_01425 [Myxococcota bacterium]